MTDRYVVMVYGLGERYWVDKNGMMTSDRSEAYVYTSLKKAVERVHELRRHGESATISMVGGYY